MSIDRLRALFITEAHKRVAAMTEGLIALEAGAPDGSTLERLFREAHSLKGSAAMVGLGEIGVVAHAMEEVLEALGAGTLRPVPDVIGPLLAQVDEIQRLMDAALAPAAAEPATPKAAEPAAPAPTPPLDPPVVLPVVPPVVPPVVLTEPPPAPRAEDPHAALVRLPVSLDRLDEMVRLAGEVRSGLLNLRTQLRARGITDDDLPGLRAVEQTARGLQRHIASARTVPVSQLGARLHRAVRDAAVSRGVTVRWTLRGGETEIDRNILDGLEDALLHMVRNSVAHGIEGPDRRRSAGKPEEGQIVLEARSRGGRVRLALSDDGAGLDRDALVTRASAQGVVVGDDEDWTRLVFRQGVSTATTTDQLAGRGVGMSVVADAVDAARGVITVDTTPGSGTTITLDLPISLAVTHCVEVVADGGRYALPLDAVEVVMGTSAAVEGFEDRPVVRCGGRDVELLDLASLLGRPAPREGPTVVLTVAGASIALRVAALVRQGEITIQTTPGGMPPNELLLGTGIADDGSAMVVLNPGALVAMGGGPPVPRTPDAEGPADGPPPHVLVVDDALTVRELQRSILTGAGYRVTTADDGRDALTKLATSDIDLLVTDVEMPRMDGYALTEAVRRSPATAALPVLILTTLADDEARRRGAEAGADGHLVKGDFSATALLDAVAAHVGTAGPRR